MHRALFLLLALLLAACPRATSNDDDASSNDDDSAVADDDDATEEGDCLGDYEPTFDKNQCLDWDGAGGLCGDFTGDNPVCDLAVSCGIEPDRSQCSIDCTMLTTINCYAEADVDCVRAATCAGDCDALTACGYFF